MTLEGRDYSITNASSRIHGNGVDITARGLQCSLQLPNVPLGELPNHENLVGRQWQPSPADLNAWATDNDGGFIVIRDEEFVPHIASVCCVGYHEESNTLTFDMSFSGMFANESELRSVEVRVECIFNSPPCPHCNHPLRSAAAKQCFTCGKSWR